MKSCWLLIPFWLPWLFNISRLSLKHVPLDPPLYDKNGALHATHAKTLRNAGAHSILLVAGEKPVLVRTVDTAEEFLKKLEPSIALNVPLSHAHHTNKVKTTSKSKSDSSSKSNDGRGDAVL